MKKVILAISVLFTFSIVGSSLAADLGGEIGKLYQCAFPVEDILIKVDGKLTEIQWEFAPWHSISHDMVNDDNDNSYTNPQKLAELEFVHANLAIQPTGKLTSTWGIIRLSQ